MARTNREFPKHVLRRPGMVTGERRAFAVAVEQGVTPRRKSSGMADEYDDKAVNRTSYELRLLRRAD